MTLSARSIALQGFGIGAIVGAGVLYVAMQGLVPLQQQAKQVYGGGRGGDEELALQVARGERGSDGWWGYVAPKVAPAVPPAPPPVATPVADIAGPGLKPPGAPRAPDLTPPPSAIPLALTAEQAKQLEALLPSARTAEEVTLMLTMVLCAPPPAPKVTITTSAPQAVDDELALLSMMLAAAKPAKH